MKTIKKSKAEKGLTSPSALVGWPETGKALARVYASAGGGKKGRDGMRGTSY